MQNNPQMSAISQALKVWQSVPPEQREQHIKNLYKSQNKNYEQEKARILEAIRSKNPIIQRLMNVFQQYGIR